MVKVWKILALLLVITVLVWITTLWRWQSAMVNPGASDVIIHLALMPLVLTAALVLTVWLIKRLRAYAAAPIVPASAAGAAPAADAVPAGNTHALPFKVLASNVFVRAGADWSGAQSGIETGDCRPELDTQLKDNDGIAVFTAAMPGLACDSVSEAVNELLSRLKTRQPDVWNGFECPAEVLRTLALMEGSVIGMRESLEAQWSVLSAPLSSPRLKPAAPASPVESSALAPTVSIRVAIPSRWSASAQQLAQAWLDQLFEPMISAGLQAAGQSRAMAKSVQPVVQLHVHAVDMAEAFWLLADQQLMQWQRDGATGLLFALAADSLLSEAAVHHMAAAQELFSGTNQRGRVPGEGAAALLLASPSWPELAQAEPALAQMHRASLMRRDKAADAAGRIGSAVLLQAAGDALKGSGVEATQIKHLTSDADHRGSRSGELFEVLQALLPHLDSASDVLRLGAGCGDLGVSRLLACIALCATQVKGSAKPSLVLGNFSPFDRFAVVLTPPVPAHAA